MKPFEPNKTAEELGIDKTRKFVVVRGPKCAFYGNGKTFTYDEGQATGDRSAAIFYDDKGKRMIFYWFELAYADEKGPEPYVPRVGDRVSVECIVCHVESHTSTIVHSRHAGIPGGTMNVAMADVKLLSRKPPRTLTKAEAETLLTEKLGESVRIEN